MTKQTEMVYPIDRIYNNLTAAFDSWLMNHGPEVIKERVHKELDANLNEVLMLLLGFSASSWGNTWEVDHCNGRSRESSVGEFLKEVQQEAIDEWFKSVVLPPPTKALQDAIRREYKAQFRSRALLMARSHAETDAEEFLQDFITEFTGHSRAHAENEMRILLTKEKK